MAVVRHKEAIHSGHFMVSDFEAEAEDEEGGLVAPVGGLPTVAMRSRPCSVCGASVGCG